MTHMDEVPLTGRIGRELYTNAPKLLTAIVFMQAAWVGVSYRGRLTCTGTIGVSAVFLPVA
jgi:hypothetical protein